MSLNSPPSPTSPLKRPHPPDDDISEPATPAKQENSSPMSSTLSSPLDVQSPRDSLLALTNPDLSSAPSPINATADGTSTSRGSTTAPPTKRQKLTPQEKAERAAEKAKRDAEKETKAKERAEAKAKKDEEQRVKAFEKEEKRKSKELEKQQKEEEHKAKEAERLKKALEKEEEKQKKADEREHKKQLKELEKQGKEEEKQRRERSQLRLGAFFGVPKASPPTPLSPLKTSKPVASPSKFAYITKEQARRKSLSIEPADLMLGPKSSSNSLSDALEQARKQKKFLPFNIGKNVTLARHNQFWPVGEDLSRVIDSLDNFATATPDASPTVMQLFAQYKIQRGYQPRQVQDIMQQLQGSSRYPIDLTSNHQSQSSELLNTITTKYFHFGEDVRPPYHGTWTKPQSLASAKKLARKPFGRELPNVNYDYDSEAEWEDPEEGEDIDIDGDEEEEEEEEDFGEFIDDRNVPEYLKARAGLVSDVEPVCSGLQWEGSSGKLKPAERNGKVVDFSEFTMGYLLEPTPQTIDPFTTAYWDPEPVPTKDVLTLLGYTEGTNAGQMKPPRIPLQDRTNSNIQTAVNGKMPKAAKVGPRIVPADVMPAFRQAVDGSDLTKIALVEHLKKQFPNLKKDEITATLPLIAERIGSKMTDKRWKLLGNHTNS